MYGCTPPRPMGAGTLAQSFMKILTILYFDKQDWIASVLIHERLGCSYWGSGGNKYQRHRWTENRESNAEGPPAASRTMEERGHSRVRKAWFLSQATWVSSPVLLSKRNWRIMAATTNQLVPHAFSFMQNSLWNGGLYTVVDSADY